MRAVMGAVGVWCKAASECLQRLGRFVNWLCRYAASITLLAITMPDTSSKPATRPEPAATERAVTPASPVQEKEPAGRPAPDPTRYGDWEKNGRCIDF
ncbi:DUF1674 domain-containing protein [Dyella mobilis]|nr:succinate dehydrogenase assembly factor 4 [Dyella mobilis]GLQ97447.1 DUF1674 domain-containing protein [Dyella mobilis]